MAEFHFLRPQMLLSLLPLVLVWWGLWRGQDGYAQLKKVVAPHLLEHLVVGETQRRWLRPVHLLSAVWILAALALAGPTWEKEPAPFADDDAGARGMNGDCDRLGRTRNLDAADRGLCQFLFQKVTDFQVFIKEIGELSAVGVPLGGPVGGNAETETGWMNFLSHVCLFNYPQRSR